MLSGTIRLMVSAAPLLTFQSVSSRCTACCFSVRVCWRSCSGSNSIVLGFSGSTVRTASVPSAKRTVMVSLLMLTL